MAIEKYKDNNDQCLRIWVQFNELNVHKVDTENIFNAMQMEHKLALFPA